MKSDLALKNLAISSLPVHEAGATVRRHWLMEEAQRFEIAARLRDLRNESVETNESIADYVGVKERTVAGWLSPTKPQGMTYEHAQKVAALFEVDIDWLWRGRERGETPDPFASSQLDRIEHELAELRADVAQLSVDFARGTAQGPTRRRRANGRDSSAASEG